MLIEEPYWRERETNQFFAQTEVPEELRESSACLISDFDDTSE